ncbi:peptide/nickel transport system permease protein [Thermocatellispora tengchongensis]|uniref:Peptide/nickel transport system permease protein n=1 Tax=Thermocatellispora tengchongensis TaxID=1073253 RepID=A0A840P7H9_9ACTN|nr:ABC transporter permease [Thermocatellispora tengchongensis]MBB5133390.1 peptide/nickel transport system permease protein [Thermocatellispora tengchongensis]
MGTVKHILWRLLNIVPVLFVVSALTFLVGRLTPGDPIEAQFARDHTPEQIEAIRASYGLNLPLWEQYVKWVRDLFTAGGGMSIVQNQPVFDILGPNFVNTLILTAAGVVICAVFGVLIGVIAGTAHHRLPDRLAMLLVQAGSNLSVYWFGLILIWIFSLQLGWLPVGGMESRNGGGLGDLLAHLVLPGVSAALISMLVLARFTRLGIIQESHSDYVRTFTSQGVPRRRILGKHIGRNILPAVVNIIGLEIGTLITGVIFVESVFNWPGIGTQLVNAVNGKDYTLIQGGVVLVALCYLLVNLVTDLAVDALNPRLRR